MHAYVLVVYQFLGMIVMPNNHRLSTWVTEIVTPVLFLMAQSIQTFVHKAIKIYRKQIRFMFRLESKISHYVSANIPKSEKKDPKSEPFLVPIILGLSLKATGKLSIQMGFLVTVLSALGQNT